MTDVKMELQVSAQQPLIDLNFEELKKTAHQIADSYTSIVITEETYKSAKKDAKELAGMATSVDKKRKEIKKVMEAPIKDFEAKCKELQDILTNAKNVIEDQTSIYDEERRKEKEQKARDYISDMLPVSGLREEFASMVVMKPEYSNLSGTFKSVREDIDKQIMEATLAQNAADKKVADKNVLIATAEGAISSANASIEQKLSVDMFINNIDKALEDAGADADIEALKKALCDEISEAATRVKEAEDRIKVKAEEEAKKKLAEEAAAANAAVVPSDEVPSMIAPSTPTFVIPDDDDVIMPEEKPVAASIPAPAPIPEASPSDPRWHMVFAVEGPQTLLASFGNEMKALCEKYGCTYIGVDKTLSKKLTP